MLASKIGNTIRLLQGMMRMTCSFVGMEAKEKLTIAIMAAGLPSPSGTNGSGDDMDNG
jgi:hypothetical protein